jgi:feruloyl esterase
MKHRPLFWPSTLAGTVAFGAALAGLSPAGGAPSPASAQETVAEMPVFAPSPEMPGRAPAFASACSALHKARLPNGEILSAQPVNAAVGASFLPKNGFGPLPPTAASMLPAFCRVTATMSPVPGSRINVEVWLPGADRWNQRYLGTGNGGPGGAISYYSMVAGLLRGFAVANTDLGTSPVSARATIYPATTRPESAVDLGHRADHQMTLAAKALIRAFYKHDATTSIFTGCSTGGQEALALAQRYPSDYDGILAGAPANNRTHLHSYFLWNFMAQQGAGLTPAKLAMVHRRLLDTCAGKDGGLASDGFLTDPRQCRFDVNTLPRCSGDTDGPRCLTPLQFTALQKLQAGPSNPRTGERIFAGVPFGTEWSGVLAHGGDGWQNIDSYTWNWTFGTGYDYRRFDFDRDLDQVDANSASYLNSNSADLGAFRDHGGKLILYTGTADPHIPYPDTLNYYERIIAANGGNLAATKNFVRYYLAPGMGHCGGGGTDGTGFGDFGQAASVPSAIDSDVILQLVRWVEAGSAPAPIALQHAAGNDGITAQRPLCAYPDFPDYAAGDPRKASSYRCVPHARGGVQVPVPRYLNAP